MKTNLALLFTFYVAALPVFGQGTYTTLSSITCFYGECQPGLPVSGVVEVSPGTFFGSLQYGVLYTVNSASELQTVSSVPNANAYEASTPIQASDGFLYIPSSDGDSGVVFKYDLQGAPEQFSVPVYVGASSLLEVGTSTLLGTSVPANQDSLIYKLSLGTDATSVVADVPEDLYSVQTLLQASSGKIYGLTGSFVGGGSSSLIQIAANGTVNVISTFGGQTGRLIEASDGNFYGCGGNSIYRLTPAGAFTTIYSFKGGSDGSTAYGCPIQASDGYLYGTTYNGGQYGWGTIYRCSLAGVETPVYEFTGEGNDLRSSQFYPYLKQGSDGKLYGFTTGDHIYSPGQFVGGTIFSFDLGLPKPAPAIELSTPLKGASGASVILSGRNFLSATSVSFNGTPAQFTVNASQYIQATVPSGATTGNITIVTPNGTATSRFTFRVQ